MNSTSLNLGYIYFPSLRSIAYLNAFRKYNVCPEKIFVLKGEIPHYQKLNQAADNLGYNKMYFDIGYTLDKFVTEYNIECVFLEAGRINDAEVRKALMHSTIDTWLFSGGGIIKQELFGTGKNFIHIHPGMLPEFRGSTTFYYSLLEQGYVGASAFFMKEEIDAGDVIVDEKFKINMQISRDNAFFMDYILDPFIRAEVLKKALILLKKDVKVKTRSLSLLDKPAYYIAHPFVRHLAVERINREFDATKTIGVEVLV